MSTLLTFGLSVQFRIIADSALGDGENEGAVVFVMSVHTLFPLP